MLFAQITNFVNICFYDIHLANIQKNAGIAGTGIDSDLEDLIIQRLKLTEMDNLKFIRLRIPLNIPHSDLQHLYLD